MVAIVVAAGTPAGAPPLATTPAGAEVGPAVPTTRAAAGVVPAVIVEKMTWGTVRVVERMERVEEEGIAVPPAEQGTVRVVRTVIVVTGTTLPEVTPAGAEVTGAPEVVGAELAAQVTIAAFKFTYGAQIPWR